MQLQSLAVINYNIGQIKTFVKINKLWGVTVVELITT